MAKAELSHNPFLLETIVRFNGQEPRVNCLIEKYQEGKLQTWIKRIPPIFHDEMNGYDFELDFTGTKLDYEDLIEAFIEAGVNTENKEQVRVFHKNELEDVRKKCDDIASLLIWLSENPNRKFDYEGFRAVNSDLFDQAHTYILFQAGNPGDYDFDELNISIESVNSVSELENTDLSNTPILFYIDETTKTQCGASLKNVLCRKDVLPEQLFFLIHPSLNSNQIERTIKDFGINSPQTVFSIDDSSIKKYLYIYPVSDYVYSAINVFSAEVSGIREILGAENEQNKITSAEIRNKIAELDAGLKLLKDADERFDQRDNISMPPEMQNALDDLIRRIDGWRKRKTKITNDDEAVRLSQEFDAALQSQFADFLNAVSDSSLCNSIAVSNEYKNWYQEANIDKDYATETVLDQDMRRYAIPAISEELLELKEEVYIEPKDDLLGIIFKQSADASKSFVRLVTYLTQDWRNKAISVIKPVAERVVNDQYLIIHNYSDELAQSYREHLEELISRQVLKKREAADQLSDDERELQIDNDFLVSFADKLREIQRG